MALSVSERKRKSIEAMVKLTSQIKSLDAAIKNGKVNVPIGAQLVDFVCSTISSVQQNNINNSTLEMSVIERAQMYGNLIKFSNSYRDSKIDEQFLKFYDVAIQVRDITKSDRIKKSVSDLRTSLSSNNIIPIDQLQENIRQMSEHKTVDLKFAIPNQMTMYEDVQYLDKDEQITYFNEKLDYLKDALLSFGEIEYEDLILLSKQIDDFIDTVENELNGDFDVNEIINTIQLIKNGLVEMRQIVIDLENLYLS